MRKGSLPVCLLIIQRLEERSCHPLVVNTRPAESRPSFHNAQYLSSANVMFQKNLFLGFSPLLSELMTCVVKTQAIKYYEKVGHTPLRNNHTAPKSDTK